MKPNWLLNFLRLVLGWIDWFFFKILKISYATFFDAASYNLFSTQTVYKIFSRVQLIIGVFMLFQFVLTIMKGIIDPDGFMGGKDGGNSRKTIIRVITCVVLLAILFPVHINKSASDMNEYEKQINNNGLLFGTLNSLQYRLLSQNTIGNLILGPTKSADVNFYGNDGTVSGWDAAETFSVSMFKAFYPINMADDGSYLCDKQEWIDIYDSSDSRLGDIVDLLDKSCNNEYFIDQNGFISIFCVIFFMFVFTSMTMDVVIRMFKLAILRIISPIPVISYMNPDGKKDGAFSAWTKTLIATYLDLFIRLATVYMILFIIAEFSNSNSVLGINFLNVHSSSGNRGFFSFLAIIIGLFAFARQAPKFVRQALGLKEDGGKLFSGFGEIGNALGMAAAGIGAIGSGFANYNASLTSFRKRNGLADDAKVTGINKGKAILSGLIGGVSGGVTGINAAVNAKDHAYAAVYDAISKKNAKIAASGRNGSTFLGGVKSDVSQVLTGSTPFDKIETEYKSNEQKIKAEELNLKKAQDKNAHRKNIMDRVNSKVVDSDKTIGTYKGITGNYRAYNSAYEAAMHGYGVKQDINGDDYFVFENQIVHMRDAQTIGLGLKDANKDDYYRKGITNSNFDQTIWDNKVQFEADGSVIEAEFGGANGLKANFGKEVSRNQQTSDKINADKQANNELLQGFKGQQAQYDAKRFHDGK